MHARDTVRLFEGIARIRENEKGLADFSCLQVSPNEAAGIASDFPTQGISQRQLFPRCVLLLATFPKA
jgi:hypothetical protein